VRRWPGGISRCSSRYRNLGKSSRHRPRIEAVAAYRRGDRGRKEWGSVRGPSTAAKHCLVVGAPPIYNDIVAREGRFDTLSRWPRHAETRAVGLFYCTHPAAQPSGSVADGPVADRERRRRWEREQAWGPACQNWL
jgi:hypothetical protein